MAGVDRWIEAAAAASISNERVRVAVALARPALVTAIAITHCDRTHAPREMHPGQGASLNEPKLGHKLGIAATARNGTFERGAH